jgi:hypothetical protein
MNASGRIPAAGGVEGAFTKPRSHALGDRGLIAASRTIRRRRAGFASPSFRPGQAAQPSKSKVPTFEVFAIMKCPPYVPILMALKSKARTDAGRLSVFSTPRSSL